MTPLQKSLYEERAQELGDLRLAHTALVIAHTRTEVQLKRIEDALSVAIALLRIVSLNTASQPLSMRQYQGQKVAFDLPQHGGWHDIRRRVFAVLDQLDAAKGGA